MKTDFSHLPFDPRKLPDPNLAVPDLSEAVEGWRAWKVASDLPRYGLPPKLYSANHNYYWTPQRAALADCPHGCGAEAPGESCSCGFYSAKSLNHLLSLGYHGYADGVRQIPVVGKVANWGKVIEASQGWRSSKSYPVSLYLPFTAAHLAKPLREAYDCKVAMLNFQNGKVGV